MFWTRWARGYVSGSEILPWVLEHWIRIYYSLRPGDSLGFITVFCHLHHIISLLLEVSTVWPSSFPWFISLNSYSTMPSIEPSLSFYFTCNLFTIIYPSLRFNASLHIWNAFWYYILLRHFFYCPPSSSFLPLNIFLPPSFSDTRTWW